MVKSKFGIALLVATSLPMAIQANNIIEKGDTSRVYDIDEVASSTSLRRPSACVSSH